MMKLIEENFGKIRLGEYGRPLNGFDFLKWK